MVKIKLFLICGLVVFLLGGGLSPIISVLALISFSFLLCLEIYEDYNKLRVLVLFLIYVGALLVLVIYVCIIRRRRTTSKNVGLSQFISLFLIFSFICNEKRFSSLVETNYRTLFIRVPKSLFIFGVLILLLIYILQVNNFLTFKLSLK
jgi:hypothetical protein